MTARNGENGKALATAPAAARIPTAKRRPAGLPPAKASSASICNRRQRLPIVFAFETC